MTIINNIGGGGAIVVIRGKGQWASDGRGWLGSGMCFPNFSPQVGQLVGSINERPFESRAQKASPPARSLFRES